VRILLVNDDGIRAPGLAALHQAVRDLGEVTVVAPDSPQSAAARSITLDVPVVCEEVRIAGSFSGIAVSGRPADCVKLAVRELMDARPELVLAGINAGANVGVNVFYSGTVAAAAEGALFGIPSVAFSLDDPREKDYPRAGRLARWVLEGLLSGGLDAGELVNVNIPALRRGEPRGVKVVAQGTAAIAETYRRGRDEGGRLVFKLVEYYEHSPQDGETDVTVLSDGHITVTPLHSDLTDLPHLRRLQGRRWGAAPD
jgi:5'-nucleotidase